MAAVAATSQTKWFGYYRHSIFQRIESSFAEGAERVILVQIKPSRSNFSTVGEWPAIQADLWQAFEDHKAPFFDETTQQIQVDFKKVNFKECVMEDLAEELELYSKGAKKAIVVSCAQEDMAEVKNVLKQHNNEAKSKNLNSVGIAWATANDVYANPTSDSSSDPQRTAEIEALRKHEVQLKAEIEELRRQLAETKQQELNRTAELEEVRRHELELKAENEKLQRQLAETKQSTNLPTSPVFTFCGGVQVASSPSEGFHVSEDGLRLTKYGEAADTSIRAAQPIPKGSFNFTFSYGCPRGGPIQLGLIRAKDFERGGRVRHLQRNESIAWGIDTKGRNSQFGTTLTQFKDKFNPEDKTGIITLAVNGRDLWMADAQTGDVVGKVADSVPEDDLYVFVLGVSKVVTVELVPTPVHVKDALAAAISQETGGYS